MTYKHVKFQDSETMRSLVKIAHQKGMIAPESSVEKALKSASAKPALDLSVTDSVQENLLKLCAGLRAAGLTTYANKIEGHIATIKFAETAALYDVSGETGEDLMDEAHPEGAVEVADADDGHGVVDTKPSAHQKLVDIVTKAQVINSLKLALAEGPAPTPAPAPEPSTQDIVRGLVHKYADSLKEIVMDVLNSEDVSERVLMDSSSVGSWFPYATVQSHFEALMEKLDAMVKQTDAQPTSLNLKLLGGFEWAFKTIVGKTDSIKPEAKKIYAVKADQAYGFIQQADAVIKNNNKSLQQAVQSGPANIPAPLVNVLEKINNLKGEMVKLNRVIDAQVTAKEFTEEEGKKGHEWLAAQMAAVDGIKTKIDSIPKTGDFSKEIQIWNVALEKIIAAYTEFERVWG